MALFNGGDSLLREAWVGVNEAGFAVMNTASYNLAPDTALVRDREGYRDVSGSRHMQECGRFRQSVALASSAYGCAGQFRCGRRYGQRCFFETWDTGFRRIDLAGPDTLLVLYQL